MATFWKCSQLLESQFNYPLPAMSNNTPIKIPEVLRTKTYPQNYKNYRCCPTHSLESFVCSCAKLFLFLKLNIQSWKGLRDNEIMHKIKQSMLPPSMPHIILLPSAHVLRQKHFVYVDIVQLVAPDGALFQDLKGIVLGVRVLSQDDLAQRSHQIFLISMFRLVAIESNLDGLIYILFARGSKGSPEAGRGKASAEGQMAVGVEMPGMLGGFGARRCKLFLIFGVALGGADEICLAGAHLAGLLEDISQSPPHLPGRAGIGSRRLARPLPALRLQMLVLFLCQSYPNFIKFTLALRAAVARLIFYEYSSLHSRFSFRLFLIIISSIYFFRI